MPITIVSDTFIDVPLEQGVRLLKTTGNEIAGRSFTLDSIPSDNDVKRNVLVTPRAGCQMIKDLFITHLDDDHTTMDETIIGVEFDRQTLMTILSQTGCEGIRFTRCLFQGKETMVAFGIENKGVLIGQSHFSLNQDPNATESNTPMPPGAEQGHGVTFGRFKEFLLNNAAGPITPEEMVNLFLQVPLAKQK